MHTFRLASLCAIGLGLFSLASAAPAAAQVTFVNFEGAFGTPSAGFPFPEVVRFDGSFSYDPSAAPANFGSFSQGPLLSTMFTFYDSGSVPLFQAAYGPTVGEYRVGNNFLNLFLGPGVTSANDPSDFRLYFTGSQFVNNGSAPLSSSFTDAAFDPDDGGFAEAGSGRSSTFAPVISARLSPRATAAPEPGSLALLLPVLGVVGMAVRKRHRK